MTPFAIRATILVAAAAFAAAAGCADAPHGTTVGPGGTITFAGLPGLEVDVAPSTSDTALRIQLTATNGSDRIYGHKDDCSEHWYGLTVLDHDGDDVYPGPVAVCALYSVPGPFAPDQRLTATVSWPYQVVDPQSGEPSPAPAGDYTVRVTAGFYKAPGEGHDHVRGTHDIPVTLR